MPRIDFSTPPEEVELTEGECKDECTRKDGYLDAMMANRPFTENNIQSCIKNLKTQKYSTCGTKKETTEEKTEKLMTKLFKFGYTEFVLRRQRINDPASECEMEGWQQGADDSDCWIDSFLFAIFANNNLSQSLVQSLHRRYHDTEAKTTPSDKSLNHALFSINLYLNLLTNRSKAIRMKGMIKWCIVWNILQYFKLTKTPGEYDTYLSKAALQEPTLTIGQGGDSNLLSCFLSEIDSRYTSSMDNQTFSNMADMKTVIKDIYDKNTNAQYIAVPFLITKSTNASSRYYPDLLNLFTHKLFLEAVVVGSVGHATSFTFCNNNWRFYDNKQKPTTTMISRQDFGSKLNKLLYNTYKIPTFLLFVYRVSPEVRGGTRKQKRKTRRLKRQQTRKRY